jgi:propionyl-CoA carboxylase alpha chain
MGTATISRLLVANRGEIARRVFRTCRTLGIETVAVFSDADATEPFVAEADIAVRLGGAAPADSYLRIDRIVDAARRAGANAVHPGYGFLAEDAELAEAVLANALVWIGPPPEAMRAMGSKMEARARMEAVGVPVLPGGRVQHVTAVDGLSFPLLVKASAGGGGKGMRIVRHPDDLQEAVASAQREAHAAVGEAAVFLERYVERPRHVEIQIFGDQHGTVVALGERDCSVQRRHQKVIEESPSIAVDDELRRRMSEAAVTAGRSIGYVGAGTVEFLLTPEREFFFLEVNTRLQVEHAVTELVLGLDLVALQIAVAEGAPLPPEARDPRPRGHAIEARLYAEDPSRGFLPQTGKLAHFRIGGPLRVDSGVDDGSVIGPHYDPMIAKVVAHGATRPAAVRSLAATLRHAEIDGVVTNRDLLVRVLEHPEFLAGGADTGFLDRHLEGGIADPLVDVEGELPAAVAAAVAEQERRRRITGPLASIPSGFRSNPSALQRAHLRGPHGELAVGYRFDRHGELSDLVVNQRDLAPASASSATPDEVVLEFDGVRTSYSVRRSEGLVHVNGAGGQDPLEVVPRFPQPQPEVSPGSLVASTPATVISVDVCAGEEVEPGRRLLVLEAMKMEHEFVAPAAGVVDEILVRVGDTVESGAVLAIMSDLKTSGPP